MQLGARERSRNVIELAEIFVPASANIRRSVEKDWAARLFQSMKTWRGFQVVTPYICWQADITVTPRILQRVTSTQRPPAWVQETCFRYLAFGIKSSMFKVSVAIGPMAVVTPFKNYDNTRCAVRDRCALEKAWTKAFGCELLADAV